MKESIIAPKGPWGVRRMASVSATIYIGIAYKVSNVLKINLTKHNLGKDEYANNFIHRSCNHVMTVDDIIIS